MIRENLEKQEIRDNPSPLISHILHFKNASQTILVTKIHAAKEIQPTTNYILGQLEELSKGLTELEKRIAEIKNSVREVKEEGLKTLSSKAGKPLIPTASKTERRQLHLSNFKPDRN